MKNGGVMAIEFQVRILTACSASEMQQEIIKELSSLNQEGCQIDDIKVLDPKYPGANFTTIVKYTYPV